MEGNPRQRLLFVEDDQGYCRAARRVLVRRRVDMSCASTLAEARSLLTVASPHRWHYVLVDDRLPDGFGLELLPLLDRLDPPPGVALLSAFVSHARAFEAFRAHRVLLPKPTTPTALIELLEILDGHQRDPRPEATGAEQAFGSFVLNSRGLLTPRGYVPLRPTELRLLRFVLDGGERNATNAEVARAVFVRRDAAAAGLVRQHVFNLRRKLGVHRWLFESIPKRGYRIAQRAFAGGRKS